MSALICRRGALLGAAILLAGAAPDAGDEVQRALDRGDGAEALRLLLPRAEAGDTDAQIALARLYEAGQGVPQDQAAAFRWFMRAGQAGAPEAALTVATMLDSGRGTARDAGAAALWFGRAAARGNHRAQYALAGLYLNGTGVPRNPAVAEALYRAAAFGGLAAAVSRLRDAEPPPPGADAAALPIAVPVLVAPAGTVTDANAAELVWLAPEQPVPVRCFVQVAEIRARSWSSVYRASTDLPVQLAAFTPDPASRYAWRVYAAARDTSHYAASEWTEFRIAPRRPAGGR